MTIYSAPQSTCAVSVVISLYNAEKFIGACLVGILAQTLQDFEVIIVDDCSTDNSVAVVESYVEKFGGRLKIFRMKKNSGCPGIPANEGIAQACGKYVFIMDDDDLIAQDTLETFYNYAEEYQADVICARRYFQFINSDNALFPKPENIYITGETIDKTFLETEDIQERIQRFLQYRFFFPAWNKFVRRDLLIDNEITFPDIAIYHDMIWTLKVFYFSKRFIHIPNALYFYRLHSNSQSNRLRDDGDAIKFLLTSSLKGLQCLTDFFGGQKFFQENISLSLKILDYFELTFVKILNRLNHLKIGPPAIYDILRESFSDKFGEHRDLIVYLCLSSTLSKAGWINALQKASALEQQLKNISTGGN